MHASGQGDNTSGADWGGVSGSGGRYIGGVGGGGFGGIPYAFGAGINDPDPFNASMVADAQRVTRGADVVVVVLGDTPDQVGEWKDRSSLDLLPSQLALLEAVVAAAKNDSLKGAAGNGKHRRTRVVVVLVHGNQLTFGRNNTVLDGVDALLSAGRPGQEGGRGIADLLLGAVSPSGRLASSWLRHVSQVGSGAAPFLARVVAKWVGGSWRRGFVMDPDGRKFDPYIDSVDPPTPLFRFGHGLTYTTFVYRSIQATVDTSNREAPVKLTVTVANTGQRDAAEVVQVYCRDPVATSSYVVRFWKRLTAFQRVVVPAGTTVAVELHLLADELGSHDDDMVFHVTPGVYNCSVGGSSVTDTLYTNFTVVSLLDADDAPPRPAVPAAPADVTTQLAAKDRRIAELEAALLAAEFQTANAQL